MVKVRSLLPLEKFLEMVKYLVENKSHNLRAVL